MPICELIAQVDGYAVVLCQQPRSDQLSVGLWDLSEQISIYPNLRDIVAHVFSRPSYPGEAHRLLAPR